MKIAMVLIQAYVLAAASIASADDDTLRFYLSKSDLVVFGEIASDPTRVSEEVGAVYYFCDFTISEVLKSNQPLAIADPIHVNIIRFERAAGERDPELKKGGVCVLFLKNLGSGEQPRWETADVWFGFQRATLSLVDSLRRVVEDENAAFKRVEKIKAWIGHLDDKQLTELVPADGFLTSQDEWKTLWEKWRPGKRLPDVDFKQQVVLVSLGGPYPVELEPRLNDQGELKVASSPRHAPKRGYGYGIAVVQRTGVKTINGKAIEPN